MAWRWRDSGRPLAEKGSGSGSGSGSIGRSFKGSEGSGIRQPRNIPGENPPAGVVCRSSFLFPAMSVSVATGVGSLAGRGVGGSLRFCVRAMACRRALRRRANVFAKIVVFSNIEMKKKYNNNIYDNDHHHMLK